MLLSADIALRTYVLSIYTNMNNIYKGRQQKKNKPKLNAD